VKKLWLIFAVGVVVLLSTTAFGQQKAMCGDVNDDGDFDISDLVFMLNWLYLGGPAPPDPSAADMDNCPGVDICDVDYFLTYIFRGGSAPCAGSTDCTDHSAGSVVLDHVDGLLSPGVLSTGVPINFYFRFTNTTGTNITSTSQGIRVYSPNGAAWSTTSADTVDNPGFDLSVFTQVFGPMGDGDDTVGLTSFALVGGGMPAGYDDVMYRITISPLGPEDTGKTICLDSTMYAVSSNSKWSHEGLSHYIPSWNGPYCFTVATPPPGDAIISLDHVDGYSPGAGGIWSGVPVSFHLRLTNATGYVIAGLTSGFKLYSPDGATWQPAVGDTASLGWPDRFDLLFAINHFSCTGSGADTVGFAGVLQYGTGLEDGFDEVSFSVNTEVSGDAFGKTLCIDSSFFPPSGYWLWALPTGQSIYPQWNGPYCFDLLGVLPGPGDSLIVPSVTVDVGSMTQPVNVKLTQPIKGASIPIKIPSSVAVDSLTRTGLITQDWDYTFSSIKPDSGFIYMAMANSGGDVIPVGEHTVFNIHFHALESGCETSSFIQWDTALSGDATRSLLFADVAGQDLEAAFDRERDLTEIPPYVPGDMDGTGEIDIADLVFMVDFMFNGGPPPAIMNTIDVNGSCTGPNIADLVYFVDYFFQGGPPPQCGCLGTKSDKLSVIDGVTVGAIHDNGATVIAVSTIRSLRGLQLELVGSGETSPENLVAGRLDLLHGFSDNRLRVGLLDLDGAETIGTGTHDLIRLEGEWQIETAQVAENGHEAFGVTIDNSMKLVTTPKSYTLHQNYPNPFNPQTEIAFSLPVSCHVVLDVYNVMGQHVATLVDGQLAAGQHSVTFDGGDIASGVYFYRLSTPGFTDTRKMVLMK